LSSAFPMGGPLQVDVRVSERGVGVAGGFPSRFLRLTQSDTEVDASLYLWWFGQLGPYEPPASLPRKCTQPREGPSLCVLPLRSVQHDWRSVLRDVLTADACPAARATDEYELRVEVFERMPYPRYRTVDLCAPMATRLQTLLGALAPNDFRRQLNGGVSNRQGEPRRARGTLLHVFQLRASGSDASRDPSDGAWR